MNKRKIISITILVIFFYGSIFFRNIIFDIFETKNNKQEYLYKLKFESQKAMFEVFGDLEILFFKNKTITDQEQIKDIEKKFNKLILSYNGLISSKNKKDLSKNFNSFFYYAELIEYYLNKDLTYIEINDKYQNYIAIFYDALEELK